MHSGMDHTVLPANYTVPASIPRKRSLDGASTDWCGGHLIAAYTTPFSTPKAYWQINFELSWVAVNDIYMRVKKHLKTCFYPIVKTWKKH